MSHFADRNVSESVGAPPRRGWAALVPELLVTDLATSRAFYCDVLGFTVAYERAAARFAYLELGAAQLMLCQRNGRWELGDMRYPLGQGVSLQICVPEIDSIERALAEVERTPYEEAADVWYRVGTQRIGQREILVQDPDGYLLRFVADLGAASVCTES